MAFEPTLGDVDHVNRRCPVLGHSECDHERGTARLMVQGAVFFLIVGTNFPPANYLSCVSQQSPTDRGEDAGTRAQDLER